MSRRIGLLLIALLALSTPAFALEGWEWMNPLPQGNDLNAVWSDAQGTIIAVGSLGTVLRGSPEGWEVMSSGTTATLYDVWGSGPDDVFVVGAEGVIVHWDGRGWAPMSGGTAQTLRGVWGSGPDDVYACGEEVLLHFDGCNWTEALPAGLGGSALWGTSPENVYLVSGHHILHYNGATWSAVHATSGALSAIWGNSAEDVYVVGWNSLVLHWDGEIWSTIDVGEQGDQKRFIAVGGTGPQDIFLLADFSLPFLYGSAVLHWDGVEWCNVKESDTWLEDLVVIEPEGALVVGRYGKIHWMTDASSVEVTTGMRGSILELLHISDDLIYAICGYSYIDDTPGAIERWDGLKWETVHTSQETLVDAWAADPEDIFVVGRSGMILRGHGRSWTKMYSPTQADLSSAWGTGPDDVYAGGKEVVLHWDGARWSIVDTIHGVWVSDIWGTPTGKLYLTGWDGPGEGGIAYQRDDRGWTPILSSSMSLGDIWGTSRDDLYITFGNCDMMNGGGYYHWDGERWTDHWLAGRSLGSITGRSLIRIALAGSGGIFLCNGGDCRDLTPSDVSAYFYSVCFLDSGELMVGGDEGAILIQTGPPPLEVDLLNWYGPPDPGDTFHLSARIDNPNAPIMNAPVCFVLEHQGGHWLWPDWDRPAWGSDWTDQLPRIDLPTGRTELDLIPAMGWPEGAGEGVMTFWGAVLTPELDGIVGRYSRKVVSYR